MNCLNAPSGAQCFPTGDDHALIRREPVSMHLLVLSAFRQRIGVFFFGILLVSLNAPSGAQCFPTDRRSPSKN